MPAGRPKIKRTEEDAKAAQRLSKRLYARRMRSQQASSRHRQAIPPSPPRSESFQATTPLSLLSPPLFQTYAADAVAFRSSDLELLHHFSTQTCYALSDKVPSQKIWQTTIPQIAFSYPFVMHGLLALSALHLAHLQPHKAAHHDIKAMTHQNTALGPVREATQNISSSNCHALFAFSAILVVIIIASPHSSNSKSLLDVQEKMTRWIRLVRSVQPMLESVWSHLSEGSLRDLCTANVRKSAGAQLPPEACGYFSALFRLCDESEDSVTKDACAGALEGLRVCFVGADNSSKNPATNEVATTLSWPYRVPHGYLVALEQGYPIAMIILAYYTIALYRFDHYWWVSGEPSRMLLSVYRLLDESMRPWLAWPLRELAFEPVAEDLA